MVVYPIEQKPQDAAIGASHVGSEGHGYIVWYIDSYEG